MYLLDWDTLLNPRHKKRKLTSYSQKKEINLLLEIKMTLQALWLCIGLIQEEYSVFISKFQAFEINWGSPSDSENAHSGLFWADARVKADFHPHTKEYWHFSLPLATDPNPWILFAFETLAGSISAAGYALIPFILTVLLWISLFSKWSFSGDLLTYPQPWNNWLQLQNLKTNNERSPGARFILAWTWWGRNSKQRRQHLVQWLSSTAVSCSFQRAHSCPWIKCWEENRRVPFESRFVL